MKQTPLLVLLVLFLVACDATAAPGGFAAAATANAGLGGRAAVPATPSSPEAASLQMTADAAKSAAQSAAAQETAVSQAATRSYYDGVATATAASVQATQQAEGATRQSQVQATAAWQATSDALVVTATSVAIQATATAVSRLAVLDEQAQRDQLTWLAQQRQADALALERQHLINQLLPWLALLVAGVVVGVGIVAASTMWRSSQPVIDQGGRVLALPSGRYQVMPGAGRVTVVDPRPQPAAPPVPVRELPPAAAGHILVVGPTRSGKSTAFRALIKSRDNVTVIDPHFAHGDWSGARVIGAGGDVEAIETQLRYMEDVLNRRMHQLAQDHTWKRRFEPMTVVTDELPLLASKVKPDAMRVWHRWLREGWKFKLYFVVGTQSTRVKTLGIEGEGDVLDNVFATLYLGDAALAEFPDVAAGMQRPAVWKESGRSAAQPVVIPYRPEEDPDSPQFRPLLGAPQPLAQLPGRAVDEPLGMATEGGFVTQAEITEMVTLAEAGHSRREISRRLYDGVDGGAPFARVKGVLDAYHFSATNGAGGEN